MVKKNSNSDWNRRYHQPEHLTIFWQKFKFDFFQNNCGSLQKVLKLAFVPTLTTSFRSKSNSNFLFEKNFCFSFSKKHSFAQEDGFCKRSNYFSSYKHCYFPLKNEAIWKIRVERIFDFLSSMEYLSFKSCSWKETKKKMLWLSLYVKIWGKKREKIKYFFFGFNPQMKFWLSFNINSRFPVLSKVCTSTCLISSMVVSCSLNWGMLSMLR